MTNIDQSRHEDSEDDEDVATPVSSYRHSSDSSQGPTRHATPSVTSPTMSTASSKHLTSTSLTAEDIAAVKFATDFHVHALGFAEIPGVPANQLWHKWWLSFRQETHRQETQLALLAWAYSSMTFVHPSSSRDRVVKGLEFRGAALQQLQKLMQNLKAHGDYATALDCTLYLGCVEWQHGLINETMAHFKVAKSFLETIGGLRVLPPQSQETVLWIFNNVSFAFAVRPLVQTNDIGQARHSPDGDGSECLSRMSLDDRSSGSIISQLIGSRLSSLVSETSDVIEAGEGLAKSSISAQEKIKHFHGIYMRKLGLQVKCAHLWHDLLDAAPSSGRDRHSHRSAPASSFRTTVCLLLRLFQKITTDSFNAMIPWKKFWAPWHDRLLDRVRPMQCDIQSRTGGRDERSDREQKAKELILLWAFFTGACIEQMFLTEGARNPSSADRTVFCSSQFTLLAGQMGYRHAGDVAADLHKYIAFSPLKQGQILKKLMQPLEHRDEERRRR